MKIISRDEYFMNIALKEAEKAAARKGLEYVGESI